MSAMIFSLALLSFAVGCGSPRVALRPNSSGARVICKSSGYIHAAHVCLSNGERKLLVMDSTPEPTNAVLRCLILTLDGRAKTLWQLRLPFGSAGLGAVVGIGPRGQIGYAEIRLAGGEPRYSRIVIGAPTWRPVTDFDDSDRVLLKWSPDGTAIAYRKATFLVGGKGRVEVVAGLIPPDGQLLAEKIIAGPAPGDFAWSADSRHIYVVSANQSNAAAGVTLEDVSWPSLDRRVVKRASAIGLITVAEDSGDIVFLREDHTADQTNSPPSQEVTVWRLSPSGELARAPVKLDERPYNAVVSPQGDRLAVVPKASTEHPRSKFGFPSFESGGLLVYSLNDGKATKIPGFEGQVIHYVAWVDEGRNVVLMEGGVLGGQRVWRVPVPEFPGSAGTPP